MSKKKKNGAKSKAGSKSGSKSNGHGTKVKVRDGVERATYCKRLPVPIDAETVAGKLSEFSEAQLDRERILAEKKEAVSEFREQLESVDKTLHELAESVRDHTELRDVECVEQLIVETNEVQVVRTDTGEVVETRTATAEDRQEALPLPKSEENHEQAATDSPS